MEPNEVKHFFSETLQPHTLVIFLNKVYKKNYNFLNAHENLSLYHYVNHIPYR